MQPYLPVAVVFLFYYIYPIHTTCPTNGIYVSTTGSDSTGNGTMNSPYNTIGMAYNIISSSSKIGTICFFPGTYSEINEIWYCSNCNISVVAAEENSRPVFPRFFMDISNPVLTLENLDISEESQFTVNNRTRLTINDITSPDVTIYVHSPNSTLIISGLNSNSFVIFPYLAEPYCDVQVSDSMLGTFFSTSTSISISESFFNGPVYLNAAVTRTYACEFRLIQSVESVLNIQSGNWVTISHTVSNNKFINNTMTTTTYDSVIGVRDIYSVTFINNMFSCNKLAIANQTTTFARILPLGTNIKNWFITGNSIDPSCPVCKTGFEPVMDGIVGCNQCPIGWVSSGAAPCTPCPPGTFSRTPSSTCVSCPPGTFTPKQNSTICYYCITGTPTQNSTVCTPCPSNYYTARGLCVKCADKDADKYGCLDCGFFTTITSDCKSLSVSGVIIVIFLVALLVIGLVVFVCVKRRGHYYVSVNQ